MFHFYEQPEPELAGILQSCVTMSNQMTQTVRYECSKCDSLFTSRVYLHQHEASVHNRLLHCPFCAALFSNKADFRVHVSAHSEKRYLPCAMCKKVFHDVAEYTAHAKLHREPFLHRCDRCDGLFTQLSGLRAHEAAHATAAKFVHTIPNRSKHMSAFPGRGSECAGLPVGAACRTAADLDSEAGPSTGRCSQKENLGAESPAKRKRKREERDSRAAKKSARRESGVLPGDDVAMTSPVEEQIPSNSEGTSVRPKAARGRPARAAKKTTETANSGPAEDNAGAVEPPVDEIPVTCNVGEANAAVASRTRRQSSAGIGEGTFGTRRQSSAGAGEGTSAVASATRRLSSAGAGDEDVLHKRSRRRPAKLANAAEIESGKSSEKAAEIKSTAKKPLSAKAVPLCSNDKEDDLAATSASKVVVPSGSGGRERRARLGRVGSEKAAKNITETDPVIVSEDNAEVISATGIHSPAGNTSLIPNELENDSAASSVVQEPMPSGSGDANTRQKHGRGRTSSNTKKNSSKLISVVKKRCRVPKSLPIAKNKGGTSVSRRPSRFSPKDGNIGLKTGRGRTPKSSGADEKITETGSSGVSESNTEVVSTVGKPSSVLKVPSVCKDKEVSEVPPACKDKEVSKVPSARKGQEVSKVSSARKGKEVSKVSSARKGKEVSKVPSAGKDKEVSEVPPACKDKEVSKVPSARKGQEVSKVSSARKGKEVSKVSSARKGKEVSKVPSAGKDKEVSEVPPACKDKEVSKVPSARKGKEVLKVPSAGKDKEVSEVPPACKDKEVSKVPSARKGKEVSKVPSAGKDKKVSKVPSACKEKEVSKVSPACKTKENNTAITSVIEQSSLSSVSSVANIVPKRGRGRPWKDKNGPSVPQQGRIGVRADKTNDRLNKEKLIENNLDVISNAKKQITQPVPEISSTLKNLSPPSNPTEDTSNSVEDVSNSKENTADGQEADLHEKTSDVNTSQQQNNTEEISAVEKELPPGVTKPLTSPTVKTVTNTDELSLNVGKVISLKKKNRCPAKKQDNVQKQKLLLKNKMVAKKASAGTKPTVPRRKLLSKNRAGCAFDCLIAQKTSAVSTQTAFVPPNSSSDAAFIANQPSLANSEKVVPSNDQIATPAISSTNFASETSTRNVSHTTNKAPVSTLTVLKTKSAILTKTPPDQGKGVNSSSQSSLVSTGRTEITSGNICESNLEGESITNTMTSSNLGAPTTSVLNHSVYTFSEEIVDKSSKAGDSAVKKDDKLGRRSVSWRFFLTKPTSPMKKANKSMLPRKRSSIHFFKCSSCVRVFPNWVMLSKHQLLHSENRGVKCSECGGLFGGPGNLNLHTKLTH